MTGHLDLVCAVDSEGRSYLREQSFCAPMHLSKPFFDGETLVVNVVNPTAGLFAGDDVRCRVRVERGARLLLTSPSASRAHRMIDGEARLRQEFSVATGGFLEVWPEMLIPQAGSRYSQKTTVEVQEGGEFLSIETLAPGRVASGESFQFERLDFETDISFAGKLIARERHRLSPETMSLRAIRQKFPTAFYASCFAAGGQFQDGRGLETVAELQMDSTWVGCSRLTRGGWVIKVLAGDAMSLRSCVHGLRRVLYSSMKQPLVKARKL